ncbi:MAG: hypothetical protein IKT68_01035 [Clostridia bacterium]|nr:hypothetical protein [Clostridia bacterium]
MKKICIVLLALTMVFVLVGCSDTPETPEEKTEAVTLVGSWESVEISGALYHFHEDGTGAYEFSGSTMNFTYTDDGAKVTIQYENATEPNVFAYTIADDTLSIEDSFGSMVQYKKK